MKKILAFLGVSVLSLTPICNLTACTNGIKHYTPNSDQTLSTPVANFLTNFNLIAINDEEDYLVRYQNDETIFTLFNQKQEAHTIAPIINYNFDNNEKVSAFELTNNNVLFKTYIATSTDKLPSANELYKDIELFDLIKNTTSFTYTTGETTMQQIDLEGNQTTLKIYFLTLNLNSNVFWNFEINKDLSNYLIDYIQTNYAFNFTQNLSNEEILKIWLKAIYFDLSSFKLANIKTIKNIDDLYTYLNNKIVFQFINLDTATVGYSNKFDLIVNDSNKMYQWQLLGLSYEIK